MTRKHELAEALDSIERDSMEELSMNKSMNPKKSEAVALGVMRRGQVMAVLGNFAEGFQLVGPFTDFEAADTACPTAAWLWSVDPPSDPQTNWANDGIQFARLIAEVNAYGFFDDGAAVAYLTGSMNLTRDQLDEVVERAVKVWDEIRQQAQPAPLSGSKRKKR